MTKKSQHQIVYRKLSELKKLPNNPRTIKKADMERLKKSVKNNPDYFEARPVILSDRTGELVIIAGNQRYEAAKALGLSEIPTVLLEGLTEEREREIIIRDNVANGDWDMDILANEWYAAELADWGLDEFKPNQTFEILRLSVKIPSLALAWKKNLKTSTHSILHKWMSSSNYSKQAISNTKFIIGGSNG